MMKVEWKDEYNLGISEIDKQHQKLFVYLATLRNGIMEGEAEESTRETIHNLIEYGREHFKFEEELLLQGRYSALDEHKQLHNHYTETLMGLQKKFVYGDEVMATDLIIFIKRWLLEHILTDDMKYIVAFKESGFSYPEMI